jgi:hypothetical protein
LNTAGVPSNGRDLRGQHPDVVYRTNDTYTVLDGYIVQTGTLHWTLGGCLERRSHRHGLLFDLGWGHTQIADVNITRPRRASLTYEVTTAAYLR